MQYRDGTVSLATGSPDVFAVWRARVDSLIGTFTAGAALTFSGGAVGTVEAWDDPTRELSFVVAGATMPALLETVAQTSPATGDAQLVEWKFQPALDTSVVDGAIFTRNGSGIPYYVGARPNRGKIQFTAPYLGASERAVAYTISQDFTSGRGYPRPNQGDAQAALTVALALDRIDADLVGSAFQLVGVGTAPAFGLGWGNRGAPDADAGFTKLGTGLVVVRGSVLKGGAAPGDVIFTLPAGYRPSGRLSFVTVTDTVIGTCDVLADGAVVYQAGGTSRFCLDSIRFVAEA